MTSSTPIRVLLATENDKSGAGLHASLTAIAGVSVLAMAARESEILSALNNHHVDVVVMDFAAQASTGVILTKKIREANSSLRVLISTGSNNEEDIFTCMDAGADGYVLRGNKVGLEMAIRSLRLGTVWLDPGIAAQVLDVITTASSFGSTKRTLPTGLFIMPLMPEEKDLLKNVASGSCADGVCMVDPDFMAKLRRFGPPQS